MLPQAIDGNLKQLMSRHAAHIDCEVEHFFYYYEFIKNCISVVIPPIFPINFYGPFQWKSYNIFLVYLAITINVIAYSPKITQRYAPLGDTSWVTLIQ